MYHWRRIWFRRSIIETHPGYILGKSRETLNDQTLWTSGCGETMNALAHQMSGLKSMINEDRSKPMKWSYDWGFIHIQLYQRIFSGIQESRVPILILVAGMVKKMSLAFYCRQDLVMFYYQRLIHRTQSWISWIIHNPIAQVSHVSRLGFPNSPIQKGGFFAQLTTKTSRWMNSYQT